LEFREYDLGRFYDELFAAPGEARPGARVLARTLSAMRRDDVLARQRAAEEALLHMGITFNVYGHEAGTEKIFPFDVVPRVVDAREWATIERGLKQRVRALNAFVADVYGARRILRDKVVPEHLIASAASHLPACQGLTPPNDVWTHVVGVDLVRDDAGTVFVLEDNLRCPSGVSYVLENRSIMKRLFPKAFEQSRVRPVDAYPSRLLQTLHSVAPAHAEVPRCVVLTPGIYNSAYFEHAFLALQMGIELVEGRDLVVHDGYVQMKTTRGLERIDVIYRRIDDTFLDPKAFRPDSMLGVPGIVDVYRAGRVALCNAPGTGVADDKVVYAYVPDMIRYYLGEDAVLPNVPTYLCERDADRAHVLDNLDKLVVKAANESGGYGMLMGPQASKAEREAFAEKIRAQPRNYIAQPLLQLSRVPTFVDGVLEGRHVDLRPYVLFDGDEPWVLPGGLTRVALRKGSYVVNSSQGGGSKDTWVVDAGPEGDRASTGGEAC
jgi:uncharacterized circularly permuted ATP-grasp superfamily protein